MTLNIIVAVEIALTRVASSINQPVLNAPAMLCSTSGPIPVDYAFTRHDIPSVSLSSLSNQINFAVCCCCCCVRSDMLDDIRITLSMRCYSSTYSSCTARYLRVESISSSTSSGLRFFRIFLFLERSYTCSIGLFSGYSVDNDIAFTTN